MYAKRNFVAGEQVRMYYGPRRSELFLQYSGFVPEDNSADVMVSEQTSKHLHPGARPLIAARACV